MTNKEIFTKAWELAKDGANKFGGSSKEYFAESLRIVHNFNKKGVVVEMVKLELAGGSKKHKSWVAKVTGEDSKYGFKREFINAVEYGVWELNDGVYNFKDASKDSQEFIVVANGEIKEIDKEEVLSHV